MKTSLSLTCLLFAALPASAQINSAFLASATTAASAEPSSLLTSLEAYWPLNEGSGNATDSASGIVLTNTSAGYTTGIINTGALFTADGQFLSVGDTADLSFGDEDFTIAAWVKPAALSGVQAYVSKWGSSGAYEYLLHLYGTTEKFRFYISGNGSAATVVASTNALSTGTWYFVVAQHDAANNLIKISVNNTGWTTAAHTTGCYDGAVAFQIGHAAEPTTSTRGVCDEVGVWRRLLTDGEITSLYNSGNALAYPF